MVRGETLQGFTGKVSARTSGKAGLTALLAAISGMWVLSGCAGLADTSKQQEAVKITPAVLNFSTSGVGQQATQTATLTNTSNSAVSVTSLSSTSSQFSTSGIALPLMLAPGESTKFQVAFHSSTVGTVSGTLSANTAHGGQSGRVKLTGGSGGSSQLSVSTNNLNYGNVLVHGSSTQAITVENSGQNEIKVSQISVSGAGFSVSGATVPLSIPAGHSVTLEVTFAPAAAGPAKGSVTITSNAQNPSVSVTLSGTGAADSYTMALSPSSVSFGNVNLGARATQTVQVSNTGNSSVTISQVSASGAGITVSAPSLPATLAPSQSLPITVTYAPTAAGSTVGSLTVSNTDGVNSAAAVTGTGAQGVLSVIPTTVGFGSVASGNTNSQTIQVSNTGTANLAISQATISGAGFSLSGLSLPLTLAPSHSASFSVLYAPTAAGAVTGSLSIISNASGTPSNIALSGNGVAATNILSVSPSSLSFGNVTDGGSASQGITLTNAGNSSVAISGVSISGSGFSILGGSGAVTLSPNQTTAVTIQFAPTAAGPASGSVRISSNATGSPAAVGVSGTGVAPATHSVALSWGASSSTVAGYNVYRSTVSGSSYARVNSSPVAGFTYSDSSVSAGTTYYYVATAVDASGNESVYSNEVPATVP